MLGIPNSKGKNGLADEKITLECQLLKNWRELYREMIAKT